MRILALLQARTTSKRLPGKVLLDVGGKPMLLQQIERARRAKAIEKLVVVTSSDATDDGLAAMCERHGIECFRGSLDDVLDRFYQAAKPYAPDHLVRLTGDCPLTDPAVVDLVIARHLESGADYTSNALEPSYPDGLDVEVCRFAVLERAWREASLKSEREHVMPFVYGEAGRFKLCKVRSPANLSHLRWTVDEPQDLEVIRAIYAGLYQKNPAFGMNDVLAFLEQRPDLQALNAGFTRNEGLLMSQRKDELLNRYRRSHAQLERAQKTIPLGAQTFSKSKTQFPAGVSPHFAVRGKAAHLWDVDGNEFVDFANSLCAVTLGYDDPDVTKAVKAQLEDGVIFSLSHPLEALVAEKMCEMIPCAEMVRFGKNGSDATAGAVRIARAFTNRDRVAVCGYHGWQDWYIGSTARNRGVPKATSDLTHPFTYNDLPSLEKVLMEHRNEFAAIILEPMNVQLPGAGFLEGVKDLATRHGSVLIFDETITGFRFANGGAQELFGVKPDLATFGKGMANGYPISAVAGRRDIMMLMEEVFFSFTYGGETLSLAAALATMTKLQREPVTRSMAVRGEKVVAGVRALIEKHQLEQTLHVSGHPTWSFLTFKDTAPYTVWQLKTLFLQEVFARGVLTLGTHNMSYAHTDADVEKLLSTYDETFSILADTIKKQSLDRVLHTKVLEPLFKVR